MGMFSGVYWFTNTFDTKQSIMGVSTRRVGRHLAFDHMALFKFSSVELSQLSSDAPVCHFLLPGFLWTYHSHWLLRTQCSAYNDCEHETRRAPSCSHHGAVITGLCAHASHPQTCAQLTSGNLSPIATSFISLMVDKVIPRLWVHASH
jgi:hypothetical protein